ncbi:DUF7563 family protein [Natronorubrum daqingense]|uniref:Small CPxCG-related zinc finger protein n=1 Tax=Natronorubrum daqingense TaxID=588898 RepID=A0A1N7F6U3_9EURY|nr:hypothetical protein SAMN05421809_3052 [Natronorubrum daqingense]
MKACDNCDRPVSDDFYRVLSDNSGELHGCLKCKTNSEATNGTARP